MEAGMKRALNSALIRVLTILAAIFVIDAPGLSQPEKPLAADKPMPSLARLDPGLWEIRPLGSSRAVHNVCVTDPMMLTQIQHPQAPCSRYIISDDAQGVTVQYTCSPTGYGRSSVRVETPRLAKIDTQGLMDNAPFAYRAEARRIGSCDSPPAPPR
jgi:hypothetical protein